MRNPFSLWGHLLVRHRFWPMWVEILSPQSGIPLTYICDLDIKVADSVVTEARSYKNIPLPRKQEFARAFMPGGEFHDASILDYAAAMRSCYGDIFIMPGMFGRKDWVTTFSTKNIETVFRSEGTWPEKDFFPSITYFHLWRKCGSDIRVSYQIITYVYQKRKLIWKL